MSGLKIFGSFLLLAFSCLAFTPHRHSSQLTVLMEQWSLKEKFLLTIIPRIAFLFIRMLSLTIRKKFLFTEYLDPFLQKKKPVIVAFWHQRLLMMPFLRHREKVSMLISRHRDGELIARTVNLLGIDAVRGSTTRGGLAALRGMVRAMQEGFNLAITPDGPQGPKHVVQGGVVELARLTGAPVLPVTYSASRRKVFQSWDNFNLPLPFSRVVYIWGEPIFVPREISKEELEGKRLLLEKRLKQITTEADHIWGHRDS